MEQYNIDARCPKITADNWKQYNERGWRWAANIHKAFVSANEEYIFHLQYLYGRSNVALGDYFAKDRGPRNELLYQGVYIKDVDDLIIQFRKEIEEWDNEIL